MLVRTKSYETKGNVQFSGYIRETFRPPALVSTVCLSEALRYHRVISYCEYSSQGQQVLKRRSCATDVEDWCCKRTWKLQVCYLRHVTKQFSRKTCASIDEKIGLNGTSCVTFYTTDRLQACLYEYTINAAAYVHIDHMEI